MTWRTLSEGGTFRVVVTKNLPGSRWLEILRQADCEVRVSTSRDVLSAADIKEEMGTRCDGVIGQLTERWDTELFSALKEAGGRVYANYAVGFDNVDVPAATAHQIAVGNTPGVLTETTAELAVSLTFAAARRIGESERYLRAGKFDGWLPDLFLGHRLPGATLGVIGAGRIGSAYARMLGSACHMNVRYYELFRNEALEQYFEGLSKLLAKEGVRGPTCTRVETIEDVLRHANVVATHVPLFDATRHLINLERLRLMKPDAVLVNSSRGPVIDEEALVEHLKANPEFRVGLDVFENEPKLAPELTDLPNAVLVPHIGSATVWTREGMATLAAANIAAILRGDPVAEELHVEDFLEGDCARLAPSIVNAKELVHG